MRYITFALSKGRLTDLSIKLWKEPELIVQN